MLLLVFRKIVSNAWKVLCLLAGSILAVGMVCSIPVYADGILQRMLTKDLEQAQTDRRVYPGYLILDSDFTYIERSEVDGTMSRLRGVLADLMAGMPEQESLTAEIDQVGRLYYLSEIGGKTQKTSIQLTGMTDFASHVRIAKGRSAEIRDDGVIEAVASTAQLKYTGMLLDHEYELRTYALDDSQPVLLRVRIVGVYEPSDGQDIYWCRPPAVFKTSLMIDRDLLLGLAAEDINLQPRSQILFAAYDYHQFSIRSVDRLADVSSQGNEFAAANRKTSEFESTFEHVITGYAERESQLRLTLQILIVPILLMLVFYIFMVSQLKIRSEAAMISVLESRGAGRGQILLLYGLESILLGLVALAAGPPLGLWMVRVIGASNGFLEFVSRKALQTSVDAQTLVYGAVAVLLIILTTLLPALIQSRSSIVQQKRKKSRQARAPFWQRFFLDIIMLGISLYAYSRLNAQIKAMSQTRDGQAGQDLDVLLFLASTLFILGAGLFFLRLYPWLLRLIYLAGKRFWNPSLYASFHQISRSDGQEQFLMIFLILALSIGLFNANAARTINQNTSDTIFCETGADLVIQEYWQPYDENGQPIIAVSSTNLADAMSGSGSKKVARYVEPDFARFGRLDGVDHATRVWRSDEARIRGGSQDDATASIMAIDPYGFGQTAWSRGDMNAYPFNSYLNVMTTMPNGVLLSANLRDKLSLEVGDSIIYSLGGSDTAEGVVVAFIDHWPGYQPLEITSSGQVIEHSLIVASLDLVLSRMSIKPYQIWISRAEGVTDKVIYEAIEEAGVNVQSIKSANQLLAAAKNDPQLQGTNGALTLGFIVSMLICAIGFLIYWILSIQGRVLQFGVFRAIGLGRGPLIGMLVSEQVLVSGVAVAFGVFLGNLSSWFFVPLFQLVYSSADQPLPFRIVAEAGDSQKVLIILAALLVICFAILTRLILRIRIAQAVKLGEE